MRHFFWVAILVLTGCADSDRALTQQMRATQDLVAAERWDAALEKAEDGARRSQASHKLNLTWRFRLLKVDVLLQRGLAQQSLAALDQYGDIGPGSEWAETRGRALLYRGFALLRLNRLPDAQNALDRAAREARLAHSPTLAAEIEMRRGTLLTAQDRFDEARAAYRDALTVAQAAGATLLQARILGNVGYTLLTGSRYDEAIPWFEQSRDLFLKLNAPDSVALADGNLGACFARLGDNENARLHYELARAESAQSGNRLQEQTWTGNAGNLFLDTKNYAAATAAFQKALTIARRIPSPVWTARWLSNLAGTSIQTGDWDAAEKYNNEALSLKRELKDTRYETSSILNAAQIAVGRHQFSLAQRLFHEVLQRQAEDPSVTLEAHMGLADLFVHQGQPGAADTEFRTTLAAVDRRGLNLNKDEYKLTYLDSLQRFHRDYVDFLMTGGQTERALEVAESSRARVLASRSGGAATLAPVHAERYRQLARHADAVLAEFWLGDARSYLWVITPQQIRAHTLPSSAIVAPLVDNYRAIIASGRDPLQVAGETGRKLYDILLKPVIDDVPQAARFIIVPDGNLYAFNFETLPSGAQPGKYWIEQATASVAPSLQFMAGNAGRARANAGLFIMGDPDSNETQYPRLKFASQEIDAIGSAMAPRTTILRGAAAQPAAYQQSMPHQFGFIHFSAHAMANEKSPLDSAVILAGPAGKSRLLARDVMGVPLSAQLVTISACRSAGGKTYAGEGLVGFAWAFLRAGAGNVIAGLWDVDDRSTEQMMAGLYQGIAAHSAIPEALRAAKLNLIHGGGAYAKPYYWAPFELYRGAVP